MENRIDEIVSINDKEYIVVEINDTISCKDCAFYNENIIKCCNTCYDTRCSKFDRRDKKDIIYRDYNKC